MSSLGKNISDQKEGEQLQFPAEHLLKERKKKKRKNSTNSQKLEEIVTNETICVLGYLCKRQ